MKILGITGGTSWASTIDYYRAINLGVNEKLGGNNFAECIIYSFNYNDIIKNTSVKNFKAVYKLMFDACIHLKNSGAKAIVLGANTMHMFAERLEEAVQLPVIHIAKATAAEIKKRGLGKAGLLGTRFTMEMDFFKDKLKEQGIEILLPSDEEKEFVHQTIFDELGKGILKEETKARYISIFTNLRNKGAEGIILGCTEIPLLIKDSDFNLPLFNTTLIHSKAAVDFALS
ncbi:MAG: aspartate/glutamate racemase family protein [Bacteroidia bacterium]